MIGKSVILIAASAALMAVGTAGAQARTNTNGAVGALQSSVKSHGGAKVKNLRGKRNPSDQGRDY